jgi:hypothetical protein
MNKIKFDLEKTQDALSWHVDNHEYDDELVEDFENDNFLKVITHLRNEASDIYDGDVVLVDYDNIYHLPSDEYEVINIDGSALYVIEMSTMSVNRYVEPRDYSQDEFLHDTSDVFLDDARLKNRNEIASLNWEYLILCVM